MSHQFRPEGGLFDVGHLPLGGSHTVFSVLQEHPRLGTLCAAALTDPGIQQRFGIDFLYKKKKLEK